MTQVFSEKKKDYVLFGGDAGWEQSDWTASDDRVRGGNSQSYLDCSQAIGCFHGCLDYETLGGAGFASQRTTGDDRTWDLHEYKGIRLEFAKGDKKRYTFNLKDELLPPDPATGREQSTISYECDFELPPQTKPGDTHDKTIFIPWDAFNATYRGRLKKDAKPIDLKHIKRVSIMVRSFFGSQKGDFSLSIKSITAVHKVPAADAPICSIDYGQLEKAAEAGLAPYDKTNPDGRTNVVPCRMFTVLRAAVALLAIVVVTQQALRIWQ